MQWTVNALGTNFIVKVFSLEFTYYGLENTRKTVYLSVKYLVVKHVLANSSNIGAPALNIKAVNIKAKASPNLWESLNIGGVWA